MATKTFSSRADEGHLAFADALCRRELGLSFGQYCGTVLLDEICSAGSMPRFARSGAAPAKAQAASFIKGFGSRHRNAAIGEMSDEQVRDLLASRYE